MERLQSLWLAYQDHLLHPELHTNKDKQLAAQNDTSKGKTTLRRPAGQRKLLYYMNTSLADSVSMTYIDEDAMDGVYIDDTGVDGRMAESFIDVVNIQPDTVRLFPWEKGTIQRLQEVK